METVADDPGLEHSKRYSGIRDFLGDERRHRAGPLRLPRPADVWAPWLPYPRPNRRCDGPPFRIFTDSDFGFRISHSEFRTPSSEFGIPFCRDKL